jgi:hypothetical protein
MYNMYKHTHIYIFSLVLGHWIENDQLQIKLG